MKVKWIYLLFAGFMVYGLLAVNSIAAEQSGLQAPAEEIIIKGTKKSAKFSHPKHLDLGVSCGQCHHNGEHQPFTEKDISAMENGNQLRCASCHNKDFADANLQTQKAVFHARCKECHKQGVDGKKGPTKCTGCHIKTQS
jgi:hypothetical protein